MGLDLTVVPVMYHRKKRWLAFDRLRLGRDYDLFSQIAPCSRGCHQPRVRPKPLPARKKLDWYGDDGVKPRTDDQYGTPLTYVPAFAFRHMMLDDVSDWNRAVMGFLAALPADTPVVLWWQ